MMILKTSRSNLSSNDQLSLDLPFAETKSLTARIGPTPTFTRASIGTFVGSNGLIQTAATNIPRFDHTSAGVCRGLLIEESRTNAAFQSGVIVNNIGWVVSSAATGATSVASGTGPDSNTSYLISESATTAPHGLYNTGTNTITLGASVTSGVAYTASAFVKKVTGSIDWVQIGLGTEGFGSQYANFNLTTGQFGNISGLTTRVEEHANGWYRISITRNATATTSTTATFGINFINNTNGTTDEPSYAGSTSNQFLLAMCQFEAGSFPTSYIPTTTGTLARSADVCSIANTASFWNSDQFTLFGNANFQNPAHDAYAVNFGITSGFFGIRRPNTNIATAIIRSSGVNADISLGTFVTGTMRMAAAHSTGQQAGSVNGASATQQNSAFVPSLNPPLYIGFSGNGAQINGHVAAIRYYKKRLPNAKLQALTV
jgi:hypothetical protein